MNYNKNKELIYQKLRDLRTHPTAEELYLELKKDHPKLGIATVYRNLNQLLKDERIIRIQKPYEKDSFDATIKEHYHVQCLTCGKVEDVEVKVDLKVLDDKKIESFDLKLNHYCKQCTKNEWNFF